MRVQVLDGLGRAYDLAATRVLVTSDDGTPAMVAVELAVGMISCAHMLDANFHRTLAGLGVDRTVFVEAVRPKPAEDILFGG